MVFAVLCLCLYARVRIYVCAWRVGLCLLSAVVPVCRGTGFVREGTLQDWVLRAFPLNGGNYTASIMGERPHCLIAYLFINICSIRGFCVNFCLFCCFVLYFVVYLRLYVEEEFVCECLPRWYCRRCLRFCLF